MRFWMVAAILTTCGVMKIPRHKLRGGSQRDEPMGG